MASLPWLPTFITKDGATCFFILFCLNQSSPKSIFPLTSKESGKEEGRWESHTYQLFASQTCPTDQGLELNLQPRYMPSIRNQTWDSSVPWPTLTTKQHWSGLPNCFCVMDFSGSLIKPLDSFSKSEVHKVHGTKFTDPQKFKDSVTPRS